MPQRHKWPQRHKCLSDGDRMLRHVKKIDIIAKEVQQYCADDAKTVYNDGKVIITLSTSYLKNLIFFCF